jgi:hypothetical protein
MIMLRSVLGKEAVEMGGGLKFVYSDRLRF